MGFDGRDTTPRFNQSPFIAFRALFDVLGTTYPTPLRFPGMDTVTEPVVDCGGKATLLHIVVSTGLPSVRTNSPLSHRMNATPYVTPILRFPGMDTVTEPVVDCGGKATLLHVGLPTLFLYLYALSPGPYRYTFPALRKSVVLQGELGAVHSPETAR